ncbi:MAG: c-type cytochrome [Acidobacteriota bacterium]
MKKLFAYTLAELALSVVIVPALRLGAQAPPASQSSVERGQYLVGITGCHDCHSPKLVGMKPDPERMLSGRPLTTKVPSKAEGEVHASEDLTAWTGGWGQSVASNLTPDPATGLGTRYNEAKFIQTMRTGKKPEGIQLLPPMPTDVYQNMKDEDLKAIYAYLRTIKPIRNAVRTGLTPPAPAPASGR